MRIPLRWRLTLFYVASMLLLLALLATATYTHLDYELRREAVERIHPEHPDWVLHAAFVKQEVADIVGELFEIWSAIAIPLLALMLLAGMWLARKSLRPVRELNLRLAEIGPSNLSSRVEIMDADAELQRLTLQVNGLLERVEHGYDRLASYSTTVAHELRTPIMLMRLQIEQAGSGIEPELAEELQEELARLGDYIERTLLSARAEQGKFQPRLRDFDLTEQTRDLAEGHALLASESGRRIRVVAPPSLLAHSDPDAFRHIFDNLVTNAMRHGTGDIAIKVKSHRQQAVVMVVNSIDRGKAKPEAGTGVGLRLVSALARALPGAKYLSHHGTHWHAAILGLPKTLPPDGPVSHIEC